MMTIRRLTLFLHLGIWFYILTYAPIVIEQIMVYYLHQTN